MTEFDYFFFFQLYRSKIFWHYSVLLNQCYRPLLKVTIRNRETDCDNISYLVRYWICGSNLGFLFWNVAFCDAFPLQYHVYFRHWMLFMLLFIEAENTHLAKKLPYMLLAKLSLCVMICRIFFPHFFDGNFSNILVQVLQLVLVIMKLTYN